MGFVVGGTKKEPTWRYKPRSALGIPAPRTARAGQAHWQHGEKEPARASILLLLLWVSGGTVVGVRRAENKDCTAHWPLSHGAVRGAERVCIEDRAALPDMALLIV